MPFLAATFLDINSATPLRNRPRWQGSARLSWRPADALDVAVHVRGNSGFFDTSVPTGLITADGHVTVNLSANCRLAPGLRLDVALRNLIATDYQDAVGFPASGRLFRAAVAFSF